MPANEKKVETLIERIYHTMSRQILSNNPVFHPAFCNVSHDDSAELSEYDLMFIAVNVHGLLSGDGHTVDVQIIATPDEQYSAYKFVSELPKEE
jgi:hypothetical protein